MARAYTPALQVSAFTLVRKLRELPLPGTSLVRVGDNVKSHTPVLSAELPGELSIIRVADRMDFEVEDVVAGMAVTVGEQISVGQTLARVKTFFGLFESTFSSPTAGIVEFFTEANAHLGIRQASKPLSVDAYVDGVVVEVEEGSSVTIEARAAFIQGVFGVGGERHGVIRLLDVAPDATVNARTIESVGESAAGAILVGGGHYEESALQAAAKAGVVAVVCGSIDSQTLRSFVGYEIGVSITGDEDVPFTLIITEGFGSLGIAQRILEVCAQFDGEQASVNGATQVRAGATRPEIIIPRQGPTDSSLADDQGAGRFLEVGARLRVIRVPYFGALGTVTGLPSQPAQIPSGAHVRVLEAVLDSGEQVVVPRANVELI